MARVKLRFKLPRKDTGIVLEKLETFLADSRKFLASMAEDLHLDPSAKWLGLNFRNASLSYTAEYPLTVAAPHKDRFNGAIISLSRSERPDFIRPATASNFYGLTSNFANEKPLRVAVFPNGDHKMQWMEVSKELALSAARASAPYAEYIGAAQGIIHAWYKEASPDPFFYLREASSDALIKCYYGDDLYKEVALAVTKRNQIIHVHGLIRADAIRKTIEEMKVDKVIRSEAYSMDDVRRFLHPGVSA
jgi:hypothetical protein